jgi:hypothetical protein
MTHAADLAARQQRSVRASLHRQGIWASPSRDREAGDTPTWTVKVTHEPVAVAAAGDWTLTGYWRYVDDPGGDDGFLLESSVGLNVATEPAPVPAVPFEKGRERVCLVRYDYDTRPPWEGAHLNLLQFAPLYDQVHWWLPIPAHGDPWDFEATLGWLLSEQLAADLRRRGWPHP